MNCCRRAARYSFPLLTFFFLCLGLLGNFTVDYASAQSLGGTENIRLFGATGIFMRDPQDSKKMLTLIALTAAPSDTTDFGNGGNVFSTPSLSNCGSSAGGDFVVIGDGESIRSTERIYLIPSAFITDITGQNAGGWKKKFIYFKFPRPVRSAASSVAVCTPTGRTNIMPIEWFDYTNIPLNHPTQSQGGDIHPWQVAADSKGKVFSVSEFSRSLDIYDSRTGKSRVIDLPTNGGPFMGAAASPGGDDIIRDSLGRIWAAQGGYRTQISCARNPSTPDHSRIFMFDDKGDDNLSNDELRFYPMPGTWNGITSIAWDSARQRIWTAMLPRSARGATGTLVASRVKFATFKPSNFPSLGSNYDFTPTGNEVCVGKNSNYGNIISGTCEQNNVVRHPAAKGYCQNRTSRACFVDADCQGLDMLCPQGTSINSSSADSCMLEFELPANFPTSTNTANIAFPAFVQASPLDNSVWATNWWGSEGLLQLKPDVTTTPFKFFPFPTPRQRLICDTQCSGSNQPPICQAGGICTVIPNSFLRPVDGAYGPWFMDYRAPSGGSSTHQMWLGEFSNGAIGSFNLNLANTDSRCTQKPASGDTNPCLTQRFLPEFDPYRDSSLQVGNLSGSPDRTWFTIKNETIPTVEQSPGKLAYLKNERMTNLPPLSEYVRNMFDDGNPNKSDFRAYIPTGVRYDSRPDGGANIWVSEGPWRAIGKYSASRGEFGPLLFHPVTPCRVIDSEAENGRRFCRTDNGKMQGGKACHYKVAGACGIPSTATALAVNYMVSTPVSHGNLYLFAGDRLPPDTTTSEGASMVLINGQSRIGSGIIPVSQDGSGTIAALAAFNNASTSNVQFIADVTGYYSPKSEPNGLWLQTVSNSACRAFDTRDGSGGGGGLYSTFETRSISIRGSNCHLPNSAQAVALNAASLAPSNVGYFTAYPGNITTAPLAAYINNIPGKVIANFGHFGLSPIVGNSELKVRHLAVATSHLFADVQAYFTQGSGGAYYPLLHSCRAYNSEVSGGNFGSGQTRNVQVRGLCGVPSDAIAVAAQLRVKGATTAGYLRVSRAGEAPVTSNINFVGGTSEPEVSNSAIIPLGSASNPDKIGITVGNNANVIVDVVGYYRSGT